MDCQEDLSEELILEGEKVLNFNTYLTKKTGFLSQRESTTSSSCSDQVSSDSISVLGLWSVASAPPGRLSLLPQGHCSHCVCHLAETAQLWEEDKPLHGKVLSMQLVGVSTCAL